MLAFLFITIDGYYNLFFFFSSRRRHTRSKRDWSSDVCSSDLADLAGAARAPARRIDVARVGDLQRRVEEVEAFEEERPLLREEDREAPVRRDLRDVRLDLREIGVERHVDGLVLRRRPLHVETGVLL